MGKGKCWGCGREKCVCVTNHECVYAKRPGEKPWGHSCPGCKPKDWEGPGCGMGLLLGAGGLASLIAAAAALRDLLPI